MQHAAKIFLQDRSYLERIKVLAKKPIPVTTTGGRMGSYYVSKTASEDYRQPRRSWPPSNNLALSARARCCKTRARTCVSFAALEDLLAFFRVLSPGICEDFYFRYQKTQCKKLLNVSYFKWLQNLTQTYIPSAVDEKLKCCCQGCPRWRPTLEFAKTLIFWSQKTQKKTCECLGFKFSTNLDIDIFLQLVI